MAEKYCCAECGVKLQELEERLKELEIERDAAIEEKEALVTENEELESTVRNLKKNVAELQKQVAEQRTHIQQYHEKETKMTHKLNALEEKVEVLEKGSATLYVAQAASLFQQSICCELLPGTFKGDPSATIKELVKYLKGQKELPDDVNDDLEMARSKWRYICQKLEWTRWDGRNWEFNRLPNDLKAIITLKKVRVYSAHPPTIELREAMKCVPHVKVRESAKPYIRNFIGSIEQKMRSCGLSHEGIEEFRHSGSN